MKFESTSSRKTYKFFFLFLRFFSYLFENSLSKLLRYPLLGDHFSYIKPRKKGKENKILVFFFVAWLSFLLVTDIINLRLFQLNYKFMNHETGSVEGTS
jgi:hypothetical protein